MFDKLLYSAKDLSLSIVIKKMINMKIKNFANVSKCNLDTKNKNIYLEIDLKGEEKILGLTVNNYSFKEKNDKYYLVISDISSSRKWLTIIFKRYIDKQEFEIPKEYMNVIEVVI